MKLVKIETANDGKHKFQATFEENGRTHTTKFGAKGMSDYTIHKDKERRQHYLDRHSGMGEHWNQPDTAGALSRWLLWGPSTSFQKNLALFKKKFNL